MGIKFNNEVDLFNLQDIDCIGNFGNGSFIGLDEEGKKVVKFIKENNELPGKLNENDGMLIAALHEGGYFETEEKQSVLKSCYLHVTNRCNLNCIGCYSFDCTRNCIDDLSLEDLKNIMDQLREVGIENITISGGEPLVRRDIVDVLKYAREEAKFTNINLITNGTFRRKDTLIQLKKYINDIAISIDGYDKEHSRFIRDEGIFDTVIGTIEFLRDEGFNVAILPTLHKKNIDNMTKYCDLAEKLGVPLSYSLMTCSTDLEDFIPTEEQLVKLSCCFDGSSDYFDMKEKGLEDYNIIARKNCGAGKTIISVGANGNIYPCHMMHSDEVLMGNIKETPLKNILDNSTPMPKVEKINKCKQCNYKDICGGGCRARALLVKNDLNEPDPYCAMFENFYESFLEKLKSVSC